jgi:hypothetical protein
MLSYFTLIFYLLFYLLLKLHKKEDVYTLHIICNILNVGHRFKVYMHFNQYRAIPNIYNDISLTYSVKCLTMISKYFCNSGEETWEGAARHDLPAEDLCKECLSSHSKKILYSSSLNIWFTETEVNLYTKHKNGWKKLDWRELNTEHNSERVPSDNVANCALDGCPFARAFAGTLPTARMASRLTQETSLLPSHNSITLLLQ